MWVLESEEFSSGGGGGNLHCWRKWVLSSIAITEEGERERERETVDGALLYWSVGDREGQRGRG